MSAAELQAERAKIEKERQKALEEAKKEGAKLVMKPEADVSAAPVDWGTPVPTS